MLPRTRVRCELCEAYEPILELGAHALYFDTLAAGTGASAAGLGANANASAARIEIAWPPPCAVADQFVRLHVVVRHFDAIRKKTFLTVGTSGG